MAIRCNAVPFRYSRLDRATHHLSKSHQDILYALNVNGKKIFGYEQAYQQYKQLYINEIKIAINQHSILLFSFALLSFSIESTYSKS